MCHFRGAHCLLSRLGQFEPRGLGPSKESRRAPRQSSALKAAKAKHEPSLYLRQSAAPSASDKPRGHFVSLPYKAADSYVQVSTQFVHRWHQNLSTAGHEGKISLPKSSTGQGQQSSSLSSCGSQQDPALCTSKHGPTIAKAAKNHVSGCRRLSRAQNPVVNEHSCEAAKRIVAATWSTNLVTRYGYLLQLQASMPWRKVTLTTRLSGYMVCRIIKSLPLDL